ncbi:MAG: hypothetical protein JNL51_02875 [Chitinophagaceae bacterium]|nr:hypothetical protein [Chitinophagaceae bacterium]
MQRYISCPTSFSAPFIKTPYPFSESSSLPHKNALQDAYAHKGRHDVGPGHIWNDFHGNTATSYNISSSAINVYKLLTNDFEGLKTNKDGKSMTFDLNGMSGEQKSQVIAKALEFLRSK